MAKKPRNPKLDFAVYLVVRVLVGVLQAVPLEVALRFGAVVGWLAYRVDKRHRNVARDNLQHAFPELATQPERLDRLVRGCFHHFGTMLVEIICIPRRIHVHNWRSFGTPDNLGALLQRMLAPRPTLIVTAHFGNWEVAGYILGMVGFRTFAIARVLDNPYLERFLKTFRQKTGQTILAKEGDFDRITHALATGRVVATLGDQDAGPKGMFVNFFHRPASTHKAVAMLAMHFDAPMVVIGMPRIGHPMKYALLIEEVIDPADYRGQPDALRAMTIRFTQAIERLVRRYPEQYFWLHRRWKHQPPAKKPTA
jgi:KDO2-lipid IV(A) lauroyltransferase